MATTLSDMIEHVLKPSLKVEEKYATYSVITDDGKIHVGLAVHQDANSITLKTADKTTITVLRENIDELTKNPQSMMPEQLLSDLTAQEAADLIAFVRGLK